jgi:flagellar hook-associated protein 3 FlgL
MSLRTPSTDVNRQALLDLQRTQEQLGLDTQRISSGNRITSPGDDPTGTALVLDFGTSIATNTQFLKQATSANDLLQSASDAMTAVINEVNNLQTLAQNGLSYANTTGGMAAVAPQVEASRSNLLSLANTQSQGKYVFAGTQTKTTPFTDTGAPAGAVTYSGDSGIINLGVTATTTVATNVPGNTIFYGAGGQGSSTDLFQAVNDLYNGLTTNNKALVQTASTNLSTIMDNLNQQLATLGGRQSGLTDLQSTISGINLSLQGAQTSLQGTDYAQTATDYSSAQTVQSATLSIMAKNNGTSLFNYLT